MISDGLHRWYIRLLTIFILGLIPLHIFSLPTFPIIRTYDEPTILRMAHDFPQTGRFDMPTEAGILPIHAREPRGYLALASWVALTQGDWIAARAFFLLVGAVSLVIIFTIADLALGRHAAWFAVCLAGVSLMFFITSHHVRMDIVLSAAIGLTTLLQVRAERFNRWHDYALVGSALILSYEAHPNVLAFVPAFAIYYIARYSYSILFRREFAPLGFVVGAVVGVVIWAGLHIAPSTADFEKAFAFTRAERGVFTRELEAQRVQFEATLSTYFMEAPVECVLAYGLTLFGLFVKRIRMFALLFWLSQLGSILLIPVFRYPYFVNALPLWTLTIAGLIVPTKPTRRRLAISIFTLLTVCAGTLGHLLPNIEEDWNRRLVASLQPLREFVPKDSLVYSSPVVQLGYGFEMHTIGTYAPIVAAELKRTTPETELLLLEPTVIILFENVLARHALQELQGVDSPGDLISEAFLEQHFLFCRAWNGVTGQIRLYLQFEMATQCVR